MWWVINECNMYCLRYYVGIINDYIDESECQDGLTNNCTQICTRNTSKIDGISSSYECSCTTGFITNENDSNLCIGMSLSSHINFIPMHAVCIIVLRLN